MLIEMVSRMGRYTEQIAHLEAGLACLEQHRCDAPGRFEFTGGFVLIQKGVTHSAAEGDYEAHRNYLDVQVLLEGAETVVWASAGTLKQTEEYDAAKDKGMYTGEGSLVEIRPGMCYLCWPDDAHKACCHISHSTPYRKAVIKLEL